MEALRLGSSFSSCGTAAHPDLMTAKLVCLKDLWSTCLAQDPEARPDLLRVISYHACLHLRSKRNLDKTVDLVFTVLLSLSKMDEKEVEDTRKARKLLENESGDAGSADESEKEEEEEDIYGNCGSLPPFQSVREICAKSHADVSILIKNSPYLLEVIRPRQKFSYQF